MQEYINEKETLSVSEYISVLNNTLSNLTGEVIGEISESTKSASGHVYFSLKDKLTGDILPCVMWKTDYLLNGVDLKTGMEILVKGKPNFYGPFGKLSFHTKTAQLVGEGALKKAYDTLKLKLEKEGLFSKTRKRLIPKYPEKIGVITSSSGAVIHDFINNLGKHGFKIKIMDTRVEGQGSGRDLILSLRSFKKEDIDVLVLIRGGGSIQSLAGFDNETLVREISNFPVPVIAGIGHHQDIPLAALVADSNASTPSIVANLINSSWQEAKQDLTISQQIIFHHVEKLIQDKYDEIEETFETVVVVFEQIFNKYKKAKDTIQLNLLRMEYSLKSSKRELCNESKKILNKYQIALNVSVANSETIMKKVARQYYTGIRDIHKKIEALERLIKTNNPERQLKLGFSILRNKGKVVRDINEINIGDQIDTQLFNGNIQSEVNSIK